MDDESRANVQHVLTFEHKPILPLSCLEKPGHETETHAQWNACSQAEFERMQQGPVVVHALVPAHPVDDAANVFAGLVVVSSVCVCFVCA